MSLTTVHTWEASGKRYRAVYDDYVTDCACDDSEAYMENERAKLSSGEWIAIGIIVSELAKPEHCATCKCKAEEWRETDSLWGIVVDNDPKAIERFAAEGM